MIRARIVKGRSSQFSSLSPLIREAGFYRSNRDTGVFAASLRIFGVPISIKEKVVKKGDRLKTLTYYILLSRHKDRAIQVLREDQSLQRFQRESSPISAIDRGEN